MVNKRLKVDSDKSKISPFASLDSSAKIQETLSSLFHYLKQEQGLSIQDLITAYNAPLPSQLVPIQIFTLSLSPAEALAKYLKEVRNLSLREIGILLNRDERTIWTNYQGAQKKHPGQFVLDKPYLSIPISVLADRSLSILEHLATHLHGVLLFSIKDTSKILKRHQSIIHTCISRALAKQKQQNEGLSKRQQQAQDTASRQQP